MESNMLPAVARDYTPKPSPVVLTELLRPVGP
jgi:hypothetical protein